MISPLSSRAEIMRLSSVSNASTVYFDSFITPARPTNGDKIEMIYLLFE